jgi:hypothetical protein
MKNFERIFILLIAFYIVEAIVTFTAPLISITLFPEGGKYFMMIVENSFWFSNILFGIAIWINLRSNLKMANSIGLLSLFNPIIGSAFFLLVTSILKK